MQILSHNFQCISYFTGDLPSSCLLGAGFTGGCFFRFTLSESTSRKESYITSLRLYSSISRTESSNDVLRAPSLAFSLASESTLRRESFTAFWRKEWSSPPDPQAESKTESNKQKPLILIIEEYKNNKGELLYSPLLITLKLY